MREESKNDGVCVSESWWRALARPRKNVHRRAIAARHTQAASDTQAEKRTRHTFSRVRKTSFLACEILLSDLVAMFLAVAAARDERALR